MCVVSMVIDHYDEKWCKNWHPMIPPIKPMPVPYPVNWPPVPRVPTQAEIDEFYELLRKAREYDKKNNQPDCEMEEKKKALLKLAEEMGITITFPDD